MDQLRFTIPEVLSLIGVTQCVYLVVYILFRAGRLSRAGLPLLYFLVLGLAFTCDLASNYIGRSVPYFETIQWFTWFYGPPLSVLLVMQIAQITKVPDLKHFWVVLLTPLAYLVASLMTQDRDEFRDWLVVAGLLTGAVSLLAIWLQRGLFDSILVQKTGKSRFWLILSIIFMNIFFLGLMLLSLNPNISDGDITLVRTILGLGFIYLVNTSLFRIYPQAVRLQETAGQGELSDSELNLAMKIEKLLALEKVYQEPTYSRADLARECGASEAVISRVINIHFQKSFPQLINEHRIADARRLLQETDAAVKIVAEEVGFNSLPSFNRVFKDVTGESPSQYRKTSQK